MKQHCRYALYNRNSLTFDKSIVPSPVSTGAAAYLVCKYIQAKLDNQINISNISHISLHLPLTEVSTIRRTESTNVQQTVLPVITIIISSFVSRPPRPAGAASSQRRARLGRQPDSHRQLRLIVRTADRERETTGHRLLIIAAGLEDCAHRTFTEHAAEHCMQSGTLEGCALYACDDFATRTSCITVL